VLAVSTLGGRGLRSMEAAMIVLLSLFQRDFLSHVCLRATQGKAILVGEEADAATTLKVLGYVRIETKVTWATPRCFPTPEGFAWVREAYLGGIGAS